MRYTVYRYASRKDEKTFTYTMNKEKNAYSEDAHMLGSSFEFVIFGQAVKFLERIQATTRKHSVVIPKLPGRGK
jgi:hypothetical protein